MTNATEGSTKDDRHELAARAAPQFAEQSCLICKERLRCQSSEEQECEEEESERSEESGDGAKEGGFIRGSFLAVVRACGVCRCSDVRDARSRL